MKKFYFLLFVTLGIHAQTVVFEESFESEPTFVVSTPCNSWQEGKSTSGMDYFTRTDGTDLHSSVLYNGADGQYFWAAMDTDSSPCFLSAPFIEFKQIPINGYDNLFVSLLAAEDVANDQNHDWDSTSLVYVSVNIDQKGYEKILQFAAEGSNSNNTSALWDMDLDGIGDEQPLTDQFQEFAVPIRLEGDFLDLKIVFEKLNAQDEDIAIDRIRLVHDFDLVNETFEKLQPILVVPNPVSDGIIEIRNLKAKTCQLSIFNTKGQLVYSKNVVNEESIQLPDLISGLYQLYIVSKHYQSTTKLLVMPKL